MGERRDVPQAPFRDFCPITVLWFGPWKVTCGEISAGAHLQVYQAPISKTSSGEPNAGNQSLSGTYVGIEAWFLESAVPFSWFALR
jgi:hypothetical protein